MERISQQKLTFVRALLELCPFVHVLGDHADVEGLPKELCRPDLILRLGENRNVIAIPDLVLDSRGFTCTLSIRPARYAIFVPWEALGGIWVGEPFEGPVIKWQSSSVAPAAAPPPKPGLRIIKGGDGDAA